MIYLQYLVIYYKFDKKLTKLFILKFKNEDKAKKWSKILSISISIAVLFLTIFLILYILIPKLMISILGIIESWSSNVQNIENWIDKPIAIEELENITNTDLKDNSIIGQ